MLFLHGAGERGSDLRKLRKYGPPRIVESTPDFPFILIAPQCPLASSWHTPPLFALLEDAQERFRVDLERVCVTGVSMGGYGTWQMAIEAPERFAAIAPICGGGVPRLAHRLRELPIWAFHGEEDDIVPLSETLSNDLRGAHRRRRAAPDDVSGRAARLMDAGLRDTRALYLAAGAKARP
jgi:predicted peptidase